MSISNHRQAIDHLDEQIVKLLNERTRHVMEIGEIKRKAGQEIYAPHRERAVLQRVSKLSRGPITNGSLRAIYREIMSSALSLEKTMTIAYLGPEATFTHQAAIQKFGSSLRYSAQRTIADVFSELAKNRAEYGVVPVENSTEGVVTHTLDMFVDSDLKVVAQIVLPIQHCLVSRVRRDQIRKLYVHPQTLAQCRSWLHKNLPHVELIEIASIARSAELAARNKRSGAVAGSLAAEKHGVPILEFDIQDNSSNATRFLVLGRKWTPPTGHDHTSIMIGLKDKVGALHHALGVFRKFKLNLIRIETRPSKRKAWEYFFFIDFAGHIEERKVAAAMLELELQCDFVKVLGSYPCLD